ncbi:MAG: hypothetical protein AAF525_13990, partial [Pseudomonadota bacterium]
MAPAIVLMLMPVFWRRLVPPVMALLLAWPTFGAESFYMLSYNIKGLPPFLIRETVKDRVQTIAKGLSDFDLVLVQEVFAYRDLVRDVSQPRQQFDGPTEGRLRARQVPAYLLLGLPCLVSAFCEAPSSSGLAILMFDRRQRGQLLVSRAYSQCHGVFGAANDCLATKGLLGVEVEFRGHRFHVYTTHLDAGDSAADR